ncbi:MAG: hypothetical protein HY738_07775 [Bacteroidia bacterium]|nr:hypothetical protein [Bacteroidia bacterium]
MRPAKNIIELVNVLDPAIPVCKENKEFYVPVFDDEIKRLRDDLLYSDRENITYYIAGQTGTGKTSALNFLPDKEIEKKYTVIYIKGRDVFDPNDVDIIDVFLMFCHELIKSEKRLEDKFLKKLVEIQKQFSGEIEKIKEKEKTTEISAELNAKAALGFNFWRIIETGLEFLASYKRNSTNREIVREFFKVKQEDLLKLTNDIIEEYYSIFGTAKKLLAVIDDLEKMKEIEQIKAIFVHNKYYLESINCRKVIPVPVHLTLQPEYGAGSDTRTTILDVKITANPNATPISDEDKSDMEKKKQLLSEIICKRIENGCNLIDTNAIELAIKMSGGLVRQFITILYLAAKNARYLKGKKVTINDVNKAVGDESSFMSRKIIGKEIIDLLNEIDRKHYPYTSQTDLLTESLLCNNIIVHANGNAWYEVNPLIKETIKVYYKQ